MKTGLRCALLGPALDFAGVNASDIVKEMR